MEVDGYCPNETPILLELHAHDPLLEVKVAYYRRDLVTSRRFRVSVGDNDNSKQLLAMLRLIEADNEDFQILVSNGGSSLYRSLRDAQTGISVKNEIRALRLLVQTCDNLLAAYPTSFDEDCDRLLHAGVPLFSNERNALIQVKGEKEVLLFYKDFATAALALLGSKEVEDFDRILNEVRLSKHSMLFHYCRTTISRLLQDEQRRADRGAADRRGNGHQTLDLSKPTIV